MDRFLANSLFLLHERSAVLVLGALLCACSASPAQVFTVEPEHLPGNVANLTTLQPTSVKLDSARLTPRTRQELVRLFQAEQGFAVRPFPLGTHGLVLHANGPLSPSGSGYADELQKYGISSKPGDRVVITKFDVRPDRIVFEFNGGPDKHHRLMQHVIIGGGMIERPLAQDDGKVPVGSRLSLVFDKYVPELNAADLRELISPMLSFSLKTPVQAFADTLPPKLKNAVLNHEVLVGMNRDMVIDAMGTPDQKVRELAGNTPFEEWIYGTPPHEVQFVRFNGNRVIRLEIADVGQPPVIRDKDETDGYYAGQFVHQVRLGDAPPTDPKAEHGPTAPPTLRQPGEKLPDATDQDHQLKPVQLPPKDPPPDASPAPIAPASSSQPSSPAAPSGPAGQAPAKANPPGENPVASASAPDGPPS
jgi:hypothetical protein